MVRGDVVRKAEKEGKSLFCKPCRNKTRYIDKPHPSKGTGVKNDPEKIGAYNSFIRARRRCRHGRLHHPAYEGIKFCFDSFEDFFNEVGPRPEGCTLDRINTLGNYESGNVRWATYKQQAQNRMPQGYWKDK